MDQESNKNAQLLLTVEARYAPEGAGSLGVRGLDEKISIPAPDLGERSRRDTEEALETLRSRLASEQNPLVKQDLEILIQAGERENRLSLAEKNIFFPTKILAGRFFSASKACSMIRSLPSGVRLHSSGCAANRAGSRLHAHYRTRRKCLSRETEDPRTSRTGSSLKWSRISLIWVPSRPASACCLKNTRLAGYQEAYAKLKEQLAEYTDFLRKEVLPKARSDFRLPPELYALRLEDFGVDYTPAELTRLAHQSFTEIQSEMQTLAAKIAKERNFPFSRLPRCHQGIEKGPGRRGPHPAAL